MRKPSYWNKAKSFLAKRDKVMKKLINNYKDGALVSRNDVFFSLCKSIIGQQISVAAANSVFFKFEKICKGRFSLIDYAKQLDQLTKMGGIQGFLKYLPGMTGLKEKVEQSVENNDIFKKQKAIISSMTKKEKSYPDIVKASRKLRISKGSGTSVQDINKLLKQFKKMSQMMKKMGKNKNFENIMSSGQMGDIQSLMNKNKLQ